VDAPFIAAGETKVIRVRNNDAKRRENERWA
jgi:hypothetical protein